jgi:hypothetical protein
MSCPTLPASVVYVARAADRRSPERHLRKQEDENAQISLPLQMSDGLPIGIQLVAPLGREDVLLRVAAQLEEAHPWADRVPQTVSASRGLNAALSAADES